MLSANQRYRLSQVVVQKPPAHSVRGAKSGGNMEEEQVRLSESGQGQGVDDSQGQEVAGQGQGNQSEEIERQKEEEFDARFHKHPRWIERENEHREEVKSLRQELADMKSKLNPQPNEDPDLKMLIDMGFVKDKAEQMLKILESRAERKMTPLKQEAETNAIERGFGNFISDHPEIKTDPKLANEMDKLFDKLSPEVKKIYSRDITSLDMLLAKAKENLGYAYEKGKQDGVTNAKLKKEAGNMSGSPAGDTELTEESIDRMSSEEFNRREKEIMAKLRKAEAEEE